MPGSIAYPVQELGENGPEIDETLKVSLRKNGLIDSIKSQSNLIWNKKVPDAQLEKFKRIIERKYHRNFGSYFKFHKWTVDNYSEFWEEIWLYFDLIYSSTYDSVALKTGDGILDIKWFNSAKFNFAENILRFRDDRTALIYADEMGFEEKVTFTEMFEEVKLYASAFRKLGLKVGDRVACYMSNRKEAIFAMLATTSIGAIWSGPLPYYGERAATNIVKTLEPKILISVDHLQDDGKAFYPIDNLPYIVDNTPSIEKVIIVVTQEETYSRDISNIRNGVLLDDFLLCGRTPDGTIPDIKFEQLPFDHPVAVNFSSGTTGLPKGPVHGAGSILGILRDFAFHLNMKSGDVVFSCYPLGWSLWDYPIPSLALGVTLCLYNGSPYYKRNGRNVWDIMADYKVKFAFLVTAIVDKLEKEKVFPSPGTNMDHLEMIGVGGSPVKYQNFYYLTNKVKKGLFVGSMYGATEVFGAFSGFDINTPAYGGEIQAPALGVDIQCFDQQGNSMIGHRGELVIATPTPSFPVYLWKDTGNVRLNDIYFTKYKGVWSQNDECWINPKSNGIVVIGRSDDTLKQNGERFGSGDIYFAIHQMEELQDYICVGQDGDEGEERALLFVKMKKGHPFTSQVRDKIANTINKEFWIDYVPKVIMEVPDVPYNLNNKRMESIVRRIVATNEIPEVMNIKNPDCLHHFCNIPELINYCKK